MNPATTALLVLLCAAMFSGCTTPADSLDAPFIMQEIDLEYRWSDGAVARLSVRGAEEIRMGPDRLAHGYVMNESWAVGGHDVARTLWLDGSGAVLRYQTCVDACAVVELQWGAELPPMGFAWPSIMGDDPYLNGTSYGQEVTVKRTDAPRGEDAVAMADLLYAYERGTLHPYTVRGDGRWADLEVQRAGDALPQLPAAAPVPAPTLSGFQMFAGEDHPVVEGSTAPVEFLEQLLAQDQGANAMFHDNGCVSEHRQGRPVAVGGDMVFTTLYDREYKETATISITDDAGSTLEWEVNRYEQRQPDGPAIRWRIEGPVAAAGGSCLKVGQTASFTMQGGLEQLQDMDVEAWDQEPWTTMWTIEWNGRPSYHYFFPAHSSGGGSATGSVVTHSVALDAMTGDFVQARLAGADTKRFDP